MADTIVETRYGKVQGTTSGPVLVWKGIPYARAPIGLLRFRPPQSPEPWLGVLETSEYGPICPQPPSPLETALGAGHIAQSEGCLSLNVWSPAADGGRRPVMVWIHGGAFVTGSGRSPWYDGTNFAAHGDLVFVTINYRLGLLGFLHLADLGGEAYAASGNCGMLDQVAALGWVRDNIAGFGGDPNRVTILGESAGGMSVGTLLAMPAAQGLFDKAILESGAAHNARASDEATSIAKNVLAELGISTDDVPRLHEVPVEAILDAQVKLAATDSSGLIAQPVVDGLSLPQRPIDTVAQGSAAGVAILAGTTRDEIKLFSALDSSFATEAELERRVAETAGEQAWARISAAYAAANPDKPRRELLLDIMTDEIFRIPAIRLTETAVAQRSPAWMYRFDWPTPILGGQLGACHALEIPFVFDNLDKPGAAQFTGDGPERQALAERMHAAWIAFARTGDPSTSALPWPAYDTARRATMVFDESCRVEDDPQRAEREAWEGLL